uniref:Uncharacterized protein n=1 Tax=viral metagenome TaxID=1070528 RepID=A0A6H2A167_9ZZZZ
MARAYSVQCGSRGNYGIVSPISSTRARTLARRYASGLSRDLYGKVEGLVLSRCPKEVRYALDHGADPVFRLLIWR